MVRRRARGRRARAGGGGARHRVAGRPAVRPDRADPRGSTSADSPGTRTASRARGASWPPNPRASVALPLGGARARRCGWRARWSGSPDAESDAYFTGRPHPEPDRRLGLAPGHGDPGHGPPRRAGSPNPRSATRATSRARRTGAATCCGRTRSSSGRGAEPAPRPDPPRTRRRRLADGAPLAVTSEQIAHLRRAKDLVDRSCSQPLDVVSLARHAHCRPSTSAAGSRRRSARRRTSTS